MRNLKRLWSILVAMAVVFPFLAYGQSDSYYDRSYARMSFVQGDVFVQRAQNQGFEKGEINLVVVQGDKLGSRSGRLEIQLGQRNYLRLDNDTQIDLVNLPGRDGDPTKLHVLAGSVFLRIYSLDRPKNFEIHTPDGSFYVLTAGLYRIDVRENRETEFSVISGSAEAAGEEGAVSIEDGQRISAANGRFTSEAGSLLARRDDFASWNESREALYARATTTGRSYLPAQYSDYESELADNGSWVDEPEYGSVWVPRGVYSDWRPYSNGRWVWYPIIGWTWVSYDSWGWAPHHYGRWGWGAGLGWYWIPRDHWGWGPAWVNWWNDDYYVGWCPLSYWGYPGVIYNNRFYGRYNRGEYYSYNHFSRSMTFVDRNRLWDRDIHRSALGGDLLRGRVDRLSLGGRQPSVRPNLDRADGIATRAASVLGRESLRSVGRGFDSGARRLSSEELRSSVGRARGGDNSSVSGSRIIRDNAGAVAGNSNSRSRENLSGGSARQIRSYPSNGSRESSMRALPSTRNGGETGSSANVRRNEGTSGATARDRSLSGSPSSGARNIREYGGNGRSSSGSISRSPSGRSGDVSSSTIRSNPARSSTSSRSLGNSGSSSGIREYGSRSSVGRSGVPSSGSSSRSYSAPSREYSSGSTARSYSAPSRSNNSGSSSRSYSAPSRSYSAPSRSSSSGSSSRSYSAPSRSYNSGSSSRSYSAPSRSYNAPSRSSSSGSSSRSYSAPSRSYNSGSSSRSYSAPSRSSSSGSSSRSYSSPSRSSSGSSRSSSSSSGRSSGGSGRRR
jgi:hypothetical protein